MPDGWVDIDAGGYFARIPENEFDPKRHKRWTGALPDYVTRAESKAKAPPPPPPETPAPPEPFPPEHPGSVFRGRALEIIEAAVREGILPELSLRAVANARPEDLQQLSNVGEKTAHNLISEARKALGKGYR